MRRCLRRAPGRRKWRSSRGTWSIACGRPTPQGVRWAHGGRRISAPSRSDCTRESLRSAPMPSPRPPRPTRPVVWCPRPTARTASSPSSRAGTAAARLPGLRLARAPAPRCLKPRRRWTPPSTSSRTRPPRSRPCPALTWPPTSPTSWATAPTTTPTPGPTSSSRTCWGPLRRPRPRRPRQRPSQPTPPALSRPPTVSRERTWTPTPAASSLRATPPTATGGTFSRWQAGSTATRWCPPFWGATLSTAPTRRGWGRAWEQPGSASLAKTPPRLARLQRPRRQTRRLRRERR
mmetsp:Transcript_5532/g.23465  ORF Transcript_5532/g.23465 Transcript_5532/m.23465 type:complete len:291 (+) Transcript_5532:2483-3355(+)